MLQLKLKRFMRQRGVTEIALADAIAEVFIGSGKSVSERHLRYIVQNTEPMIGRKSERRPSLVVLGFIIKGLRQLTGENVSVSDVLEYQTETPETRVNQSEIALEDDKETEKNSSPVMNYELAQIESDAENTKTLDEI
jgi:hypothetical protein